MSNKILNVAIAAALLGSVTLVGCKKKEEPVAAPPPPAAEPAAPPPPAEPPPAPAATASVTAVDLGTAIGADKKVAAPTTTFAKKDKTIYASVTTATSDPAASVPGKIGAKWTFQDGQVVSNDAPIDASFTGTGNTEFHITKPDGWPAGKYKVEISLDGTVVQSKDFEVK
jgi:hypothetical protein